MMRIKEFLASPSFEDEYKQRVANLQHFLLPVLSLAALLLLGITYAMQLYTSSLVAIASLLIFLFCLWLVRRGQTNLVGYLVPFALIAATTFVLITEHQHLHDYTILVFPVAIILAGLFIGRRAPLMFSTIIIGCILAIYISEQNGWIAPSVFANTQIFDVFNVTIYIMITGLLVTIAINIINTNLSQMRTLNLDIQKSEANYRLLFKEIPGGMIITDKNGVIQMANPGICKLLGYAEAEILGKRPREFMAPEDLEKREVTPLDLIAKEQTIRNERILLHKDGTRIHTDTSSKALPDGRFQFLATDITDRIQAEQATQDANIQLEQRVAEHTAELKTTNTQLAIELAERQKIEQSLRMTLARTETLYQIAHTLIAPHDFAELLTTIVDKMVAILSADEGLLITFELERKKVLQFVRSGVGLEDTQSISFDELWAGLSGWVMRTLQPALSLRDIPDSRESEAARARRLADQRGSIIVVPLHYRGKILGTLTALNHIDQPDFTETDMALMIAIANQASIAIQNAHLFENLQQHAHNLEIANKELESFAYSVSHDLRAPLRAIQNYSQIVIEDYIQELDESGQNYLSRIIAATQRMNELIETLLTFSQLTRVEIRRIPLNMTQLAAEILENLRDHDPKRSVRVTLAPDINAYADPKLMGTVLSNLLSNAWKYTTKTPEPQIKFGVEQIEGESVYFVRDNGVGFDMCQADKLFTPFQRLHDTHEFPGHGVGLATVQRIIHRHGGKVWAEAEIDQGATFYFTLGNPSNPKSPQLRKL